MLRLVPDAKSYAKLYNKSFAESAKSIKNLTCWVNASIYYKITKRVQKCKSQKTETDEVASNLSLLQKPDERPCHQYWQTVRKYDSLSTAKPASLY